MMAKQTEVPKFLKLSEKSDVNDDFSLTQGGCIVYNEFGFDSIRLELL